MAKRSDLRLVKEPVRPIFGGHGQKQGETPGQTLEFRECVLRIPKDGDVAFSNGTTAPASEVVSYLERHRLFMDQEEGFWRVDPTAPPVSGDEMKAINRAAIAGDEATLTAIIDAERAGWGREDLISTAQEALETVRRIKAELEAEAKASKPKAKE
jgi:hypothetical protein